MTSLGILTTWIVVLISFTEVQCPKAYLEEVCKPNVQFRNCLAQASTHNRMWNIQRGVGTFIDIEIIPKCHGSVLKVQWLLTNKGLTMDTRKATGRIEINLKSFKDKHAIYFAPYKLKAMEYILIARVTEWAFMVQEHTIDAECWIKVIEKRVNREIISPRANNTQNYKVVLYINTPETGWTECANPDISLLVSGKRRPMHTFFGELKLLDYWVNSRTWWVVGTWSWTATYSKTRRTGRTGKTSSYSRTSTYSTRADNKTGHVGYPQIYSNSFYKGFKMMFEVRIKNYPEFFQHIKKADLFYGRVYRFLICEDRDTYALGCANASTVTCCYTWAYNFNCTTSPKSPVKTVTLITMKCRVRGTPPTSLAYGINTIVDPDHGKRPPTVRLAASEKHDEITVRLFLLSHRHTIYLYLLDNNHMLHRCDKATPNCKAAYATYQVISSVEGDTNKMKFDYLTKMKDGEKVLTKFSEIAASENLGEAVQCAHVLISELEFIDVTDTDRTKFQADLLEPLSEVKTLTWPSIEMLVGLLERFDMFGVSKEVFYSKLKSTLLREITEKMQELTAGLALPLVTRWAMENRYFPELYRQVSLMFDSDYVKPFLFSITTADNVPYHIYRKEEYELYDGESDETLSTDYSNVSANAIKATKSLLFARSLAHYQYDYHIDSHEHTVTSRIFIEKGDVMFVIKEIGAFYSVNLGEAERLEKDVVFRLIWSLLDKNSFFWHTASAKFRTPYLLLNMYYDRNEKTELKPPPKVYVSLHGELTIKMHRDGVTVPNKAADWTSKFMDRFIRSYRILITEEMQGSTFTLFLDNITTFTRLQVIINSNNRRPRLADFEDEQVEKIEFNNKTKISHMIPINRAGYWFIGVIPFKEDVVKSRKKRQFGKLGEADDFEVATYAFAPMRLGCPVFNSDDFAYDICKVSENSTVSYLTCDCEEIGKAMGTVANALRYKSYGILDVPVKLLLAVEYRIIIATIIVIAVYCLLLVIAPYRTKSMEMVYFLSDNAKSHRYGYMVKVQTASVVKSGTTAYIGIKLYGTADESKRHILNYPDPNHKLLQNGCEDRLLIANDRTLGYLSRIEIWSDCSGYAPEWFCENIEVYDLQNNRQWYFAIQKRFGVDGNLRAHYFVKPNRENQVTVRSPWVHFNTHFGASHTWNIVDASQDAQWTYMERLTVVLSHVLTTFAITLILIHPIELRFLDGIGINHKPDIVFYVKYIAIVTIICAPLNFVFVVIFRNSKKVGRFRGSYGYFPPHVHKWTWIWLILLVMTCLSYCLICGPFIAYTVTYDWTIIVIASLVLNVFICENIFLAVYSITRLSLAALATKEGTSYQNLEIIADVENQRRYLYENTDKQGLRPHLTALYIPLSGERLKKRRRECQNRQGISYLLSNMINLIFFAILLIWMIVFNHNDYGAGLNRHLEEMFITPGSHGPIPMGSSEVIFFEDIYEYMNTSLVNALTCTVWYSPYAVSDAGMIPDYHNKYLGSARVRQKRVFPVSNCPASMFVEEHWPGISCVPPYHEDHSTYNSSYDPSVKHNKSMWHFHEHKEWNQYEGVLQTYDGDGYSMDFGKIRGNSLYRVQIIYDNDWFDRRTKLVVIEMIIYNAYANLFTDFKVVFEREAQYIMPTFRIYTAQLVQPEAWRHTLNMLIFLIYILVTAKMFILFVIEIIQQRWDFFSDSFRSTMLLIVILNIAGIAYFIERLVTVDNMLEKMKHTPRNEYFEYCHIFRVHRKMETLFALMAFLVMLLLLQFTRFVSFTMCLVMAIQKTIPSFIQLFFGMLNAMVCFGFMCYMLFGNNLVEFLSPVDSIIIALYMCARAVSIRGLWYKIWLLGGGMTMFLYIAILLVFAVLKLYFIIICMQAYHYAKVETSSDIYRYTLTNYIAENIHFMKQAVMRRLRFFQRKRTRGGGRKQPIFDMVSPRVPKYRYKDKFQAYELTLQKQRIITLALLRNKFVRKPAEPLRREDYYLMKNIMRSRAIPSDAQVSSDMYFKARVLFSPKTRTTIVPNERLEAMAAAADHMLVSKHQKTAETSTVNEVTFEKEKVQEISQSQLDLLHASTQDKTTQQLSRVCIVLESTDAILDVVIKKVMEAWRAKKIPKDCCQEEMRE